MGVPMMAFSRKMIIVGSLPGSGTLLRGLGGGGRPVRSRRCWGKRKASRVRPEIVWRHGGFVPFW